MIDANINIVTGETIYLSHGSFSDHTIHPYVALVEFNMKYALIEMMKESTQCESSVSESYINDFVSKDYCFQYDFIHYLIKKSYIISPNQRIIELGGDDEFTIKENSINPEQERKNAIAQEEYETMMGYIN